MTPQGLGPTTLLGSGCKVSSQAQSDPEPHVNEVQQTLQQNQPRLSRVQQCFDLLSWVSSQTELQDKEITGPHAIAQTQPIPNRELRASMMSGWWWSKDLRRRENRLTRRSDLTATAR